ncbi:DUF3352 domain-containing protein [Thermocoleostomius sinensis]|uniref:DUF3352 domain-containing protein n=1 Tax=Thermocoleostomius sinensis A174 TaxID=2016057 RepID=A0A9E9C5R4_9CYAN|nr:DUF3352 domain-containing protein [Thermocoleostomius sinensis]WAL61441.1 DUF3352 domain-containing protein [Thermocoleostomius sinensis A174]
MKTRSFVSILVAIFLVLLLIGGVGAYWLAANHPNRALQAERTSHATQFVSRQSPLVVSLLVNPDRLAASGLAKTPPGQRQQWLGQWRQFRQTLLEQTGLNYRRDIQPWLGNELTFAVTTTDFDRDLSNGRQTGYLIAAAIHRPEQAERSIQAFWQRQATTGADLVFEPYAGVTLIHANDGTTTTPDSEQSLTTAMIGDQFVLFANSPKVLRDAINNLQVPELSLGNSESYQQAIDRLTNPRIGMVYVHFPQLASWLEDTTISDPTIANLSPTFDSLVMDVQLTSQGLLADALLLTAPGQTIEVSRPQLSEPVPALQYIPATSPLVVAGKNLAQLWQQLDTGLAGSLQTQFRKPLQTLAQRWQVQPEEIFALVPGEYALSWLNQDAESLDWVIVTERSDATIASLAHLDDLAQNRGDSVSTFTIADQPVTAWTKLSTISVNSGRSSRSSVKLEAEVEGVHTTVGNYEVIATSLDAMTQAIDPSQPTMLSAGAFQQAIAPLPTPNSGYLYLDKTVVKHLERSTNLRSILKPLRPFLEPVQSVTISGYGGSRDALHSIVFLKL